MNTHEIATDTEERGFAALADYRAEQDRAQAKFEQDRLDNALLAVDTDDLGSATTADLQAALDALRDEPGYDAAEIASDITEELWSRGEQD